jgi:hypothetical protein
MGKPYTSGLGDLFSNGGSLFTQLRIPVKPADLPGHQSVEVTWSNGKFTQFGVPLIGNLFLNWHRFRTTVSHCGRSCCVHPISSVFKTSQKRFKRG